MLRRSLVAFAFVSGVAFADPIPKESETAKIKRVWGELVDAGGDAKIKLEGEKLKMTVPSGDRLVYLMRGGTPTFAPYIYQKIGGDFVAMVTVHRHVALAGTTGFAADPLTGSGLLAIFDNKTILSFCRATKQNDEGSQFRSTFRYPAGSSVTTGGGPAKQGMIGTAKLKLTRSGDLLRMEYSLDDGKKWQQFSKYQRATNDEVKIGIYAEHSCDAVTEAVFEGFSVKALVDEKKP